MMRERIFRRKGRRSFCKGNAKSAVRRTWRLYSLSSILFILSLLFFDRLFYWASMPGVAALGFSFSLAIMLAGPGLPLASLSVSLIWA